MGRLSANWLKKSGFDDTDTLIETGTKDGVALSYCAKLYKKVIGVELDPVKYEQARKRLAPHQNATVYFGDSRQVLPRIIDPARSTTFFLDAHWVPTDQTAIEPGDHSAILGELQCILPVRWQHPPRIIVDDAWMFIEEYWRIRRRVGYITDRLPKDSDIAAVVDRHGYSMSKIKTGSLWTNVCFLITRE